MNYIDWYLEKKEKNICSLAKEIKDYKDWEDLVTETQYAISNDDYDRIYKVGKEKLQKYLKEEKLEAIEQLFYQPEKEEGEARWFSSLPYIVKNTKRCARLCDYVCFRTACLYAIKYNDIKQSDNFEKEKRKVRIQGLTYGFVDNLEKNLELEQIEKLLQGETIENVIFLKRKTDLVKGGMIKIKQYYLETNKIPEIRGASSLLDNVNNEKIEKMIKKEHIKECLIYAGGGKMMGIFPEGCGEEICKKMEQLVEEETVTAQSNFYSHPYEITQIIKGNYKEIIEEMDLFLEEHQGICWDFRINSEVPYKEGKFRKLNKKKEEFCSSCRQRYATVELFAEPKDKLCQSCLYKRLAGGKDAKYFIFQEYQKYINKNYGEIILNNNFYNKLEDIAEDGFIGVIYGDANSMSNQIDKLDSFMTMRYFSEVTSDTVTNIVFDALFEHLGKEPAFEIIAVGGDDIFLIVSGKKAYDIACSIGKLFDKQFQNRSIAKNKITMSVGVCITHDKMPVQYSFDIAQKLLKSAKQKAWEERSKKDNHTGTIDWMVIENDTTGSDILKYQRDVPLDISGKQLYSNKTLRPYTWKQAEAVKNFIKEIELEKSFVFQLRKSWYQHTKEEAELFYLYQISRKKDKGKNFFLSFNNFAKEIDSKVENNNIKYEGKLYSPWIDIVELWDYVGVENEKDGNRN